MKESTKLIFSVLGLVLIFAAAVVGYNYLSKKYKPTPVLPNAVTSNQNTDNTDENSNGSGGNGEENQESAPELQKAPDFTVYDADGSEVTLTQHIGKPVIVNFWATWCGPCKSEMPHFEKAYLEFGDEIEFMMINPTDGINDTHEAVAAFLKETGYTFPVYYDTESNAGITYGITGFPMTFFIDKDGFLLGYYPGAMDEATLYSCIDIVRGQE